VAIITRSLPKAGSGGMEQVVVDLVRAWRARGAMLTVITAEPSIDAHRSIEVPVVVVAGNPYRTTARWTRAVAAAMDWHSFDVVLGVSAAARAVARLRNRPPVVMQAHGTSIDEIITKLRVFSPRSLATVGRNILWCVRDLFDAAHYDATVAVGPGIAVTLGKLPRRFRARNVTVICNGVPVRMVPAEDASDGSYDFDYIYVGRLHREKGVDLLAKAVRGTSIRLAIAGDGPQGLKLRRMAAGSKNISFLGRLAPDEVAALRLRARAAVMPSRRREGLPLAALESLSSGRPVMASAGVLQAFGETPPHGVERLGLSRRAIRSTLARGPQTAAVVLPRDYWAGHAADQYFALFERLSAQ
jgi:glycosyltransferase involved in cell wall biosynthesis